LLIAFLLLSNPLYLPLLNLDLSSHTYSVEPVTVENGAIEVAGDSLWDQSVDGIACSGWRPTAACVSERKHVHQGDLEFNITETPVQIETRYAYHPTDGRPAYYRRALDDPRLSKTLLLEPVAPETVVESLAVSPSQLSVSARVGLAVGGIQTDRPLEDANRIIDTDDGYVMIVETRRQRLSSGDTVEALFSGLLLVSGLIVLWRTYRRIPADW
jgi:hypothetical protein